MIKRLILSCSILILVSTYVIGQDLIGKYRTNFADLGFFMTEIEFKPEFRFHYTFEGDLQHRELDGNYKMVNKLVYLRFDSLKNDDIIKIVGKDTIVDLSQLGNIQSYDLKNENGIEYHLKYRLRGNRLFSYHVVKNKIVRRAKYYSDKKRFLLFGPEYHYKKWYLKKIPLLPQK
jgi:hypothetical protein